MIRTISFTTLPKWLIFVGALGIAAFIGWLDHKTGWELSLFVLYAFPILLLVWHGGRVMGILLAVLCAGIWWWANRDENPYVTSWGYGVASFSRFVYFVFVALGGAALKAQQDADRARIAALERTRELEREIVQVSEHEQRRIGQDLHDGLCQELASIGCAATMLREDLALGSQEAVAGAAMEIEDLLKNAVVRTRDLARGIFPVQMEAGGLVVALGELVQNARRLHRINIAVDAAPGVKVDDPDVGMHLYRITQEALANAIRHGKSRNILISLRSRPDEFELRISDDGAGLPEQPKTSGMGLKTMKYRAEMIGAELTLGRNASGGVEVVVTWKRQDAPQADSDL